MATKLEDVAKVYFFLHKLYNQDRSYHGNEYAKGLTYVNTLARQTYVEVPKEADAKVQFQRGLALMREAYNANLATSNDIEQLGRSLSHLRHALYDREMALRRLDYIANKYELVVYLVDRGGDKIALNKLKTEQLISYYLTYASQLDLQVADEAKLLSKSMGSRLRREEFFAGLSVGDIAAGYVNVGSDGPSEAYSYTKYYKITQMSADKKTLHMRCVEKDQLTTAIAASDSDEVWRYGGAPDQWLRPGDTYWHYNNQTFHFSHP